ncbi:MAG: ATP-binding cassette domain-containing protein [Sporolactobacillus sp.]
MEPLVEVSHLTLAAATNELVTDLSLTAASGESIGLVGESGSGKSLTLRAILGLLPEGIRQTGGTVHGSERCGMVFQDPVSALDPLYPVVKQITEVVHYRQQLSRHQAKMLALEWIRRLRLPDDLAQKDRYPHQLSGGQRQRIVIALALACHPNVLLCHEPTTALDVTVQQQIMDTIRQLQQELHFTLIFVTHNLALAATICDRLYVMKDGQIVEQGRTEDIVLHPQERYTKKLIDAVLPLPDLKRGERL